MWVNCYRLNTRGQSMRTSSIGEAMHWSMKGGFDQVYATMTLEKSATTMMNKANRRSQKSIKHNAQQVRKTKLWTKSETHNYLTDYCERKAEVEWNLSSGYEVIRQISNVFYVWKPSLKNLTKYGSVVPSFFRIRVVRIVDGKFASCSCGLPARNKYPCRHIMAVIKKRHRKMYSIRWLIHFSHTFGRQKTWTDFWRKLEAEENSRDVEGGEHILVEGLLDIANSIAIGAVQDSLPLRVKYWNDLGKPIVRGQDVPRIPFSATETDNDECLGVCDGTDNEDGFSFEMELPEEIETMRKNDTLFTQESQQETVKQVETFREHMDETVISLAREGLKLVQNDKKKYDRFVDAMKKAIDEARVDDSKQNDCILETIPTGKALKKYEKRKRPYWDK